MTDPLRILIVSEDASAQFGGEAALPLHYFRVLRRRGLPVWLVTHERTKKELSILFPDEPRISYVEDTALHRLMWRAGRKLPARIAYLTVGYIARFTAQLAQRKLIRNLIRKEKITLIHQPMPVSPREPSLIYGFGIPVVIGPMNGGMDYPPAFRRHRGSLERALVHLGRLSSALLNFIFPGKRQAALLLVANSRTGAALPWGTCARVRSMVENGVDLDVWQSAASPATDSGPPHPPTFAFIGRLVDWKAVDLLLHAFKEASRRQPMSLLVMGDGVERGRLESLARTLGILAEMEGQPGCAFFTGWLSQRACADRLRHSDCLVLPSLLECGGAVVLEAMSSGKPVIATAWGGPTDYLNESCAILVPPTSREALIAGLENAMVRLTVSPALRQEMGQNGRRRAQREYDWEIKVERMLEIYGSLVPNPQETCSRPANTP